MIVFINDSNLLEVTSGIIMHGCNSQGVMGSGVAKQLRAKYPDVYLDYLNHLQDCKVVYGTGKASLGTVAFTNVSKDLVIASAITQEFYGKDGKLYVSYDTLNRSARSVLWVASSKNMPVHIPYMLGAGLGGGDLCLIKSIIEDASDFFNVTVYCHIFTGKQ